MSEVIYLKWLANIVLVKKVNEKWEVCIDFTDLNKAYSRDIYSFPYINQQVNYTAKHKLLNFLDAYSSYRQILMANENRGKTFLITN